MALQVLSSTEFEIQTQATVMVGNSNTTFNVTTRSEGITPNNFKFSEVTNAELNSEVASNTVTISGLDGETPLMFLGFKYSLNGVEYTGGSQTVSGFINNGDELTLYVQTGSDFNTLHEAAIAIGREQNEETFSVTTRSADITPSDFEFTHVEDSEPSISNTSNTITLAGIDDETNITIEEGMYSLNGGEFTSETGKVKAGDTLALKITSKDVFATLTTAAITVGDFTASYNVTTREKDTNPIYTAPASLQNVAVNSYVESSAISFSDFDGDEVAIIGAEYKLNDSDWAAAGTTTITENDVLTLRVLSSNSYSTQVSSSVSGNGWIFSFNITTLEDTAPTVIFNKTFEEDSSTPLNGSEELVLTFSETMQTNTLTLIGDMVPNCNDLADATSCLNLDWSENDTVLTMSPKEDFYWYSDKRSLQVAITGDGTLGLEQVVSATVLPVFETFQAADVVIGQNDFESRDSNVGSNRLNAPYGVSTYQKDGQVGLLISDTSNNRVVKYNSIPTDNGANFDELFGQGSDSTSGSGTGNNSLNSPRSAIQLNDRIYIAEQGNDRATWVENSNFDVNGGLANSGRATSLVGQQDFGVVIDDQCSQNSLSNAAAMDVVETESGTQWLLADNANNRVMIWSNPDETKGNNAVIVLGQESFDDCQGRFAYEGGEGLKSLKKPTGVWSNGEKLVVSSNDGNRLLVWNTLPTDSNQLPDFQLGQESDSATAKNASKSITNQRGMNGPRGIGGNDYQMCVADNFNHRVLVWNSLPENSDDLADIVIGQSNFTKSAVNDTDQDGYDYDTPDGRVLNYPIACDISMEQLFIADPFNHRVLVFNALNKRPEHTDPENG